MMVSSTKALADHTTSAAIIIKTMRPKIMVMVLKRSFIKFFWLLSRLRKTFMLPACDIVVYRKCSATQDDDWKT
jgi:hypothetical protein